MVRGGQLNENYDPTPAPVAVVQLERTSWRVVCQVVVVLGGDHLALAPLVPNGLGQ